MKLAIVLLVVALVAANAVSSRVSSSSLPSRLLPWQRKSLAGSPLSPLSPLSLLSLRGGSEGAVVLPVTDKIFTPFRSSNAQVNALLDRIERSSSVDDIFQIIEEIPAIKGSMDRAMKIAAASLDDAVLAIQALARVARILSGVADELDPSTLADMNQVIQDRRIEQLTECVELQLSALRVEDLCKYLWSLVVIDLVDGVEFTRPVIAEFHERLRIHNAIENRDIKESKTCVRLASGEKAMMIWSLGCVQDRHASAESHDGLLDKLLEALLRFPFASSNAPAFSLNRDTLAIIQQLNAQLVVRMLWSLSIHAQQNAQQQAHYRPVILAGLQATTANVQSLSLTNKITLLWCSAQHGLVSQGTLHLLRSIASCLQSGALDREDLHYVVDSVRFVSSTTRNLFISLSDEEAAAKEREEEEEHRRRRSARHKLNHAVTDTTEKLSKETCLEILDAAGSLIRGVAQRTIAATEKLPLDLLISIHKAMATVELNTAQDRTLVEQFLQNMQKRVIEELEGRGVRGRVTPRQAANLLEALVLNADYPSLLGTENSRTPENTERAPPSVTLWELVQPDPVWHKIAGRLAVICSVNPAKVGDKAKIVDASWAVACLAHSYRPLFRVARRATQFVLHEQTPQTLARLAVSIASEEAASFASGGGMSVKLDHEFVDLVAISTLRRLKEVPSLKEKLHAVVSIAFLGRLSSSGTRLHWTLHPGSSNNEPEDTLAHPDEAAIRAAQREKERLVEISPLALSYLTTKQLIRLQWAVGRLPLGIFGPTTIDNLRKELDSRALLPSDSPIPSRDTLSIKDAFLYVKTLVDSAAIKENSLDNLKDKVCGSLMQHCEMLFATQMPSPDKEKFTVQDKTFFMIANPSILIDTIQAFIELNWYNAEMDKLCSDFLESCHLETNPGLSPYAQRAVSFQRGILVELLKVYKDLLLVKKGQKKLKGPKRRVTGFLSKVLGVHDK